MANGMPDFLIIGAPKSGTTSLYHYLDQHPGVFMSPNKEPHFFAFEGEPPSFVGTGDTQAWINTRSVTDGNEYRALFSGASSEQMCGEASTMYLYLEGSCDRIYQHNPNMKIVAFLRQPVDRAYSHYMHLRRDGREWESDFRKALELENERIGKHWSPAWHYRNVGLYCDQVQRYVDKFGKEQVRIYLYDDLLKDAQGVYRDIFEFIGVDADFEMDTSARHNTTKSVRKSKWLHDFLMYPNGLKSVLRQVIPASVRKPLSAKVYRKNAAAAEKLSAEVRHEVTASFETEILRLQDLIGRDLSGWLATP